ncbi:YitT family protein [Metabacillus arenae]
MSLKERSFRWFVFFIGLSIMALGIVLTIKADLGASPWDVLHIGLYMQFGLTIGSWAIIVGVLVLFISGLMLKKIPQIGAFLNMVTVGVFIDIYLLLPIIKTPDTLIGKFIMLAAGIFILTYGMGLYISARCGAGPRDSLMIALVEKTSLSVGKIRGAIELIVLGIGWVLGGPVFIGTVLFTVCIGYFTGLAVPQTQKFTDYLIQVIFYKQKENLMNLDQ